MTVPTRTDDQRLAALEAANYIRGMRAELKRELRAGGARGGAQLLANLISDPPSWLCSMRVWDACLAVPKVGPMALAGVFRRLGVSQAKTVCGLSDRQREAVTGWLADRAQL
jgi:hypothetical protein